MSLQAKSNKLDILNGSIWNKLPLYAIPVAATRILEQLFNASDIAIVGNFASTDRTVAIAAVGANSPVIGVILNLFFVIVIGMNVNGVATATVISNIVSSSILFIKLTKTEKWIHLDVHKLSVDKACLLKILRIGLPAGIQSAVFNIANLVIQSAINSLGTLVIAASSAAFNLEILVYYVFNSFSQACTTFVGQNYGAKQIRRCKKVLLLCVTEGLVTTAAVAVLILSCGKFLLSLFNSDPQVIAIGYTRLVIIFSAYIFSLLYEIMSGYLRGFGISFVPALLTTIGVCGTRIAWVYAVFPNHRNFSSLMIVYPVSLSTTALLILIAVLVYRPARRYRNLEK